MRFTTPVTPSGERFGISLAPRPPRVSSLPSLAAAFALGALLCTTDGAAQTLEGRLLDGSTDDPVEMGLLIMRSTEGDSVGSTITDGDGRFSLSASEPGSFVLIASAFGYHESTEGVFELGEDAVMTVEYRLAPAPLPIDEIVVELGGGRVLEPKLVRQGFVRRMQRGLGHFLTPWEIERSPETSTSGLLDRVPGVVLGGSNLMPIRSLLLQGPFGPCMPRIYLDGILVQQNGDIDLLVPLPHVEAVEVYRRSLEVPLQYSTRERARGGTVDEDGPALDNNPCGVVLFWTKS